MGTWGTGTFQTDIALDWLGDLQDARDPAAFLRSSLTDLVRRPIAPGLTARSAEHVLCAAELILALLGEPSERLDEDAGRWVAAHPHIDVTPLIPLARDAIALVLRDDSELHLLWLETDAHADWSRHVIDLRHRLIRHAA